MKYAVVAGSFLDTCVLCLTLEKEQPMAKNRNEYMREWSRKNREKVNKHKREHYRENKSQLQYYYDNKEEILKKKKTYSETGRKWIARYKATEEQWKRYRDATHCECCGVEFEAGKGANSKCQDHNHDTGELRDVICGGCNLIEGMIRKRIERLQAIKEYFKKYPHDKRNNGVTDEQR